VFSVGPPRTTPWSAVEQHPARPSTTTSLSLILTVPLPLPPPLPPRFFLLRKKPTQSLADLGHLRNPATAPLAPSASPHSCARGSLFFLVAPSIPDGTVVFSIPLQHAFRRAQPLPSPSRCPPTAEHLFLPAPQSMLPRLPDSPSLGWFTPPPFGAPLFRADDLKRRKIAGTPSLGIMLSRHLLHHYFREPPCYSIAFFCLALVTPLRTTREPYFLRIRENSA